MGITSQIHRSLHEMESSISTVSFALIPRETMRKPFLTKYSTEE